MDTLTSIPAPKLPKISGLFRESWQLYRSRFGDLIGIVLVPFAVSTAGVVLADKIPWGVAAFGGLILFAGIVLGIISYIAIIYALKDGVGIVGAYKRAAPGLFPYLWVSALTAVITIGGYILAIVPGLIFSIWFMFAIFILLIEDKRGFEAIMLSKEYVRGYFWPIAGRLVVFVIVALVFLMPFSFVSPYFGRAAAQWIEVIPQILIAPFSFIYFYLLYRALRDTKPELASNPFAAKKGFFVFAGILGAIALVVVMVGLGILLYFSINKIDPPFI